MSKASFVLKPDETLVLELPGGGGFGHAAERSSDALRVDLLEGYVSAAAIEADYGRSPSSLGVGEEPRA